MIVKPYKYGIARLQDNKENILRHREMSFIDIFLEGTVPLSYKDISYGYDVGIVAKHVNRPIVELISKEDHPRPTCYDDEVQCVAAMEEHAKLWAVPDGYKHTDEIVGLANYGNSLVVMRGLIPQPVSCVGVFSTYAPEYDSRMVYGIRVKEHEKFGLKDAFDSQRIFYLPTNVTTNIVESKSTMVCLSHSVSAISSLYREAVNRLDKYFPDVNPTDYVEIIAIDISSMPTGFLSDHADDLEYYVGQNGWWRFINVETLSDYIQSHPECVVEFDFGAFNKKEGVRFDLGENTKRNFADVRTDDFEIEFGDSKGKDPLSEATVTIDYLVDEEEDVFKQRLTPYRAVVKFKVEDYSFIPSVGDIAGAIGRLFTHSILSERKDLTGLSFYVDDPILDNFTSSGFVKATKNELVYYGVLVNNTRYDIMTPNTTIDDLVRNRHALVSYLKAHADSNQFKWVCLADLVRQHVPVGQRARFFGIVMEIIRIENNSDIVNDFVYRWFDGYVYLAYVGKVNDIEISTDDVYRVRSKLLSPVTDDSNLPDLKRLKFIRDAKHQDDHLYGWDWFYILEDGKYRKVKGYVLTDRVPNGDGSVAPNQGARVTLKDPDGVDTTLFIDGYRLSKGMVTTHALSPVGGIYRLDNYKYVQIMVGERKPS